MRHTHDLAAAWPTTGGSEDRNAGQSFSLWRRAKGDLQGRRSVFPSHCGWRARLLRPAAAPIVPTIKTELMSGFATKQTSHRAQSMSAFGGKADIDDPSRLGHFVASSADGVSVVLWPPKSTVIFMSMG